MIVLIDSDADKIATLLKKELLDIEENYKTIINTINNKLNLAKSLFDSAKEINPIQDELENSFSYCIESAAKAKESKTKVYNIKKQDIENCLTLLYSGSDFYGNE